MFNVKKETLLWEGKELTLETGKLARQATSAVVVGYGDCRVLCTVAAAKEAAKDVDFFPLSVHYQEKYYAAGRIPGGFVKRESKPSEKEVLTSRLIDRPLRPLFPKGFFHEVQVICTVLSHDGNTDTDILSIIGASAALSLSGLPFMGPVGAARVGYGEGKFSLCMTQEDVQKSELDLVVAGTSEGVLMVESKAQELPEDIMLGAVHFGFKAFQPILKMIQKLAKSAGKSAWKFEKVSVDKEVEKKVKKEVSRNLTKIYNISEKKKRYDALDALKNKILLSCEEEDHTKALNIFEELKAQTITFST